LIYFSSDCRYPDKLRLNLLEFALKMFVATADCSLTRRRFLVMTGAALAASLGVPACSQIERTTYEVIPESPDGLGVLAKRKGIVYGANIGVETFLRWRFPALAEKELAGLAPTGSLEFGNQRPTRDRPLNFGYVDLLADFAKAKGMEFRIRPFFWWYRTPSWFKELDKTQAEREYVEFIRSVIGHYKGQAASWDAFFESIHEDGYGMRDHEYMRKFGERHLDLFYQVAREMDPTGRLIYSEYGLEYNYPQHQRRRSALLKLLDRLLSRRVPIDVLGIQGHLHTRSEFSERSLRSFLRQIARMGLEIYITELDCGDFRSPLATRDQEVADEYFRFLSIALAEPAVVRVYSQNLIDPHSWIHDFPHYPKRPDGFEQRPLPFDKDLRRKPAWTALARAFDQAPVRQPTPAGG
jgi:endo-1,4-beta-xylanase